MADRGPVKIRQGAIEDLIALYKRTYKKLVRELLKASDAGKINKSRVMARINFELAALGVDVNEWVKREIPQYYLDGANVAQQDLRALGVDISSRSNFAVINREAIKALIDETALNFANAIIGISRNGNMLMSDALKQQLNFIIAEGKLTGEARRVISANLQARLQAEGLTSLRDKSGRRWSFENYTDMLARTKAVEARNQGLINRMLSHGYDLVQITNHRTEHKACAVWEGKILSVNGQTPKGTVLPGGLVVAGSLQDATQAGLFHPRCKHAANVINPELAAKTKAYDNPYNRR